MQVEENKFIFNISPTRVAGAIIGFDKKKEKAVVKYKNEVKINLKKDFSEKDFRKETLRAIDEVCLDFIKVQDEFSNSIITKAEVFLMSPWVDYDNYTLKHEAIESFLVDEKYLDSFLLKKNEDKTKELLGSEISSIKVNEYEIDPILLEGKKIQKIEASFLDSFMAKFDKHFIQGAIQNHFSLIKIEFHPFLSTLFNQIRRIYDTRDDFVFLDISSEITEFGIYTDGEIKNLITIPFGQNKIVHKISELKKIDFEESESILKMYLSNILEDSEKEKIKKIIQDETTKIRTTLDGLKIKIPQNVFLVSSKRETNKIIKNLNIFKELYFIDKRIIEEFILWENRKEFDNFIALEAEYLYS